MVFKTTAIDHSAISPRSVLLGFPRIRLDGLLRRALSVTGSVTIFEPAYRVPEIRTADDSIGLLTASALCPVSFNGWLRQVEMLRRAA